MLFSKLKAAIKSAPLLHGVLLPYVDLLRRSRNALQRREINRFRKHCLSLSTLQEAVFVKVGANDGVTGDPCSDILLSHPAWKGLLIEPVPYCFERLKENFGDAKRFSLEQVAIGKAAGKAPFYFVDQNALKSLPDLPFFFDQLGSFDRNHILKHLDSTLEPFIIERDVEVCTLSDVLRRNGIRDLHLLHIDAEGYDYEILKTLDFAVYAPTLILIEHKHLSDVDRGELRRMLCENGYSVRDCGADYFALNEKAYRRLLNR